MVPYTGSSLQPVIICGAAGVGGGFMGMLGSQAAAAARSNRTNSRDGSDVTNEVEVLLQRRAGNCRTASPLTDGHPAAVGADHDR
jgi:hypothetical protein